MMTWLEALAAVLRGIVGQRLVRRSGDGGRVAVLEVMVNTGRTAEAIADPERTGALTSIMAESGFYGMQTFDQHLIALHRDGVIELEDALGVASNPTTSRSRCGTRAWSPDPAPVAYAGLSGRVGTMGGDVPPPSALRAPAGRPPLAGRMRGGARRR